MQGAVQSLTAEEYARLEKTHPCCTVAAVSDNREPCCRTGMWKGDDGMATIWDKSHGGR